MKSCPFAYSKLAFLQVVDQAPSPRAENLDLQPQTRQFWLFFGHQLLLLPIFDSTGPLTAAGTLGAASYPTTVGLHYGAVSHYNASLFPPTAPVSSDLVTQASLPRGA